MKKGSGKFECLFLSFSPGFLQNKVDISEIFLYILDVDINVTTTNFEGGIDE